LDIETFARNIKRVARDQRLRESMKANAREYALRHLNVEKMKRDYGNLFWELLGTESSPASTSTHEQQRVAPNSKESTDVLYSKN
jgi:hypothetical protein